jgi:hypothetical protein
MYGIGGSGGRGLIDKVVLIVVLGSWLSLTLRAGISGGMRVRGGSGKSELRISVGGRPSLIVLCRRLSLKVWIIKSGRSANHIRWGVSRVGGTGMVRMSWEGIGRRGGEG